MKSELCGGSHCGSVSGLWTSGMRGLVGWSTSVTMASSVPPTGLPAGGRGAVMGFCGGGLGERPAAVEEMAVEKNQNGWTMVPHICEMQ